MIRLNHKNKQATVPNKWDELTPSQFVATLALCTQVLEDKLDLLDFRLHLLKCLTGYKPARLTTPRHREQIENNLFTLAMLLRFPLKPAYLTPEYLEVFSPDLQADLKYLFPFEIYNPDQMQQLEMVGDQLKWVPALNLNFGRNLLPQVELKWGVLHGPIFDMVGNTFDTDLRTGEYIDAMDWSMLYQSTKDEEHLNKFIATIYRPCRNYYNPNETADIAKIVSEQMDANTKNAIVLVFAYFAEKIAEHPLYSLFFSQEKSTENNTNPIGLKATVFAICADGLGTRDEIMDWPLPEFYNSMYYRLSKSVEAMRRNGIDDSKINKETGISLDTLEKI